jgi:hypothetical protein
MKRLFTFGCSYTSYQWPTWADFVGSTFDYYENWGRAGSGNTIIASKLHECNFVNKFNKDDTILIMLSSCDRFDYIDNDSKWVSEGNIYNDRHSLHGYFTEKAWNQENALYSTWYNVNSIITLLNSIGCNYKIMKGFDFFSIDGKMGLFDVEISKHKRVLNIRDYFDSLDLGTSLTEFHNKNPLIYKFPDGHIDGHPTVMVHHNWVKENMDEFYKPSMLELCQEWEQLIVKTNYDLIESFRNLCKIPFITPFENIRLYKPKTLL